MNKKSEFITVRVTPELKEKIEKTATKRKWTVSQTVKEILEGYYAEPIKEEYMNDWQPMMTEIAKGNKETLIEAGRKLGIESEDLNKEINYIINKFGIMWPID